MASLMPLGKQQYFSSSGAPLVGGKVYTYAAGTTTPLATYSDKAGVTPNTNPVVLDSRGEATIFWGSAGYKVVLKDSTDVTVWTQDNLYGSADQGDLLAYEAAVAASGGSALVGFLQSGAGAVATTVQAKLRESVSVKDFGAVGDGVTDDTSAIQSAINTLSAYQTLNITGNFKITSGLTITNKSNIRITGGGTVFFSGAASGSYMFQLVGTVANLEIDHLTLVGDNNSGYTQTAIGCNSGQTVSNTNFHDLNISNINVGISHNCFSGGSWTKGVCHDNTLTNILGTVSGSGYGIHISSATDIRVYDNVIDGAQRHSIYQASGANCNNVIHNNVIRNHRSTVYNGSLLAAIHVSRGSNVSVLGNKFYNCFDCQILVDQDTATSLTVSNVLIQGNTFSNRGNVVPAIFIGEQATPTTAVAPFNVTIDGNTFLTDVSVASGPDIKLYHGTQIYIQNNTFRRFNVTASLAQCVELGDNSYISSDAHIKDVVVKNNVAAADAAVAATYFSTICNQLCTGSSPYTIKDNYIDGWASEFNFQTTPTNVNSKLKFRTTVTNDFASVPANSGTYTAKSILGVKPTSLVTGNCQSWNTAGGNNIVFSFYPIDVGVNNVIIQVNNTTTSAYDPPNQSFVICVEDI